MKEKKWFQIMVFVIIFIIIATFILSQFIINPLGWILAFLSYSLWDGLLHGTWLVKLISFLCLFMLFGALFGITDMLYKKILNK